MKIKKRRPLRNYQCKALSYINRMKHAALFLEMRLGKTLIVIRWIRSHPEIKRILVVCPYSAFFSWKNELRLEGEPSPQELIGDWQQRSAKLYALRKWYLINKEGHLVLPNINKILWDVIILDESTFIKNPKTKISKFFIENFRQVSHRIILTGTPAPESELDYFQQLQFLDPSILKEKSYWSFRFRWFTEISLPSHSVYAIRKEDRKKLAKVLSNSCFFLTRKEAGMKNIKVYEPRYVSFNKKAQKVYDTLRDEFLLELEGVTLSKSILAVTQFIWMRRLFGGFVEEEYIFDGKYKELKYLLDGELKNESIIIWCTFIQELEFLYEKLTNCGIIYGKVRLKNREQILTRFQNGSIKILLAQPECFKYGTDLSISDTMIYFSTPLGLESRLQSEDRIINLKKSSALIIDLVVENTIEERILKSLKMKESKQEMIRGIVRRLQNEIT